MRPDGARPRHFGTPTRVRRPSLYYTDNITYNNDIIKNAFPMLSVLKTPRRISVGLRPRAGRPDLFNRNENSRVHNNIMIFSCAREKLIIITEPRAAAATTTDTRRFYRPTAAYYNISKHRCYTRVVIYLFFSSIPPNRFLRWARQHI